MGFGLSIACLTLTIQMQIPLKQFQDKETIKDYSLVAIKEYSVSLYVSS